MGCLLLAAPVPAYEEPAPDRVLLLQHLEDQVRSRAKGCRLGCRRCMAPVEGRRLIIDQVLSVQALVASVEVRMATAVALLQGRSN